MSTGSLVQALAQIPDPRSAQGRRHPLPAVLTLATVAMLSGARSLESIAQFGRDRGRRFARALGFTHKPTPCKATFHYLFKRLDIRAFEGALSRWAQGRRQSGWKAIAVDGKTLRGTTGEQLPGVHLLAAYAHEAKCVLGQMRVKASTNEHKQALALLDLIPLQGAVVTGDAMFCQRDLSRKIRGKGGDWLWQVKDNQPGLKQDIAPAFDARREAAFSPLGTKGRRRGASTSCHRQQRSRPYRATHPRVHHGAE